MNELGNLMNYYFHDNDLVVNRTVDKINIRKLVTLNFSNLFRKEISDNRWLLLWG